MAGTLKETLTLFREECTKPELFAKGVAQVQEEASKFWSIVSLAFSKDDPDTPHELLLDVTKTWSHYQPSTVVLAFFSLLISNLDTAASFSAPNKFIRLIYTIFDEIFSRTVEEEDEMVFIVKSITLQLSQNIRPTTVKIVIPLLRHLVRFSSLPKLRNLYNHMYDIRDFYCTEFLGRGQFAEVLKGYNKHSGTCVALKKMKFSTVSKGLQAALLREAAVMAKMANVSVVRLYDNFQEDTFLYLVMEYSPLGDMEGYIESKKGKFDLSEISHMIRELSNGLRFLRSQAIVHRDLKPANILMFNKNEMEGGYVDQQSSQFKQYQNLGLPSQRSRPSSGSTAANVAANIFSKEFPVRIADLALKLTDFTMARRLDDGELAKTVCGSPLYMAPEVLNRRQYTDKADLWSVGVILYRLIFNTMPFNGLNELDLRDNLNHKPVPIPENDPRLTPELLDLLTGLLQKDPFLRIDWEEFFMHPFLRPPRLGSTMMTSSTLASETGTEDGITDPDSLSSPSSHLLSISAHDAMDLQRKIREYEARLQLAQQQVQQLLGDLEQSKLRELLKEQQQQQQVQHATQQQHAVQQDVQPNSLNGGPQHHQYGAVPNALPPASTAPSTSTNPLTADVKQGTIRFGQVPAQATAAPSGSAGNARNQPSNGSSGDARSLQTQKASSNSDTHHTNGSLGGGGGGGAAAGGASASMASTTSFYSTPTPSGTPNSSMISVTISQPGEGGGGAARDRHGLNSSWTDSSASSSTPNVVVASLQSDLTDLAISRLSEKLQRLGGGGKKEGEGASSSMSTSQQHPLQHSFTPFSSSSLSHSSSTLSASSTTAVPSSTPPNNASSSSSSSSAATPGISAATTTTTTTTNTTSTMTSRAPHAAPAPASLAPLVSPSSNVQLLLSQIHPDRDTAIEIVQQLLAEVLVAEDGDHAEGLEHNRVLGEEEDEEAAVADQRKSNNKNTSASPAAPSLLPPHHALPSRPVVASPSSVASSSAPPAAASSSSAPGSSSSSSSTPSRGGKPSRSHPFGMSPEQAEAWDLERATIVAEGEQWRQLFSNLSNDYETLNSQLNEAKTMVAVLEDDLKDKGDKIATYAKLEQEYTRSTIYLEDQLRGSRERVSYLEAEFQALDTYRHQMAKRN